MDLKPASEVIHERILPGPQWPGLEIDSRLEAICLSSFWRLCRWLGPEMASDAGAALLRLIEPIFPRREQVKANVAALFPGRSAADKKRLTSAIIANFGRVLAEYPHLEQLLTRELAQRVEFQAASPEAVVTPDRAPAIYIGAHQANWEVLPMLASQLGQRMTVVVAPRPNPFIDRLVRQARPQAAADQLDRDNATRGLMRALQSGSSVALLADHRFPAGRLVPFFGHPALTAIGPARLALKFNCDLVPTRVERIGRVRFRITTFPAVRPDPKLGSEVAKAVDMMRRINILFEGWIRERPEEWICLKRRWPKKARINAEASPGG